MSNPIPMLPNQPECGSPCATCEALAHVNGKLLEELAAAREALKRALPVLEEYAEDESVFWGGASHYIAKDAIEVFEQARAALDAAKEDEP